MKSVDLSFGHMSALMFLSCASSSGVIEKRCQFFEARHCLINDMKREDPTIVPPEALNLTDGQREGLGPYYLVFFYISQENELLLAYVPPHGKDETTLALVAVQKGLTLGQWKEVNHELSSAENEVVKKHFEQMILAKLSEKISK